MTDILRLSNNNTPIWPYSVAQFRADEPHLSISDNPHDAELASYATLDPPIILCRVQLTPPPVCAARTERVEQGDPTLTENGWQQTWTIRPATAGEITDYDFAHRPAPDWATFKSTALNSATLNAIVADAFKSAPVAAASLAPALLRAEGNGSSDFAAAWSAICAAVPVPAEVIAGFQQVATGCNLPDEFVAALSCSTNGPDTN